MHNNYYFCTKTDDGMLHFSLDYKYLILLASHYKIKFSTYFGNYDNNKDTCMVLDFNNPIDQILESIASETFIGKPGLIEPELLNKIYDFLNDNLKGG